MENQAQQRIKKSYSISRETESFVRQTRQERKIRSDSEALDQLLRNRLLPIAAARSTQRIRRITMPVGCRPCR
jgi:hypothetical protein